MYKKIYRQEGGLAEEGYRAQIREAARKKIEEFNRSNRGEVGQRVRTPKPRYAPRRRDNNLNLDSDLLNQAGRLATEYIKNPTKIPTDKGLTTLFHGTPYKEGIMDEGFKSSKVFTTTDPKKALDYAKEGRLRGTPFGPVTGDVLETKVPTSQAESLLKRGLTRTPEVVLSPEEATKIFQTGGGDIVGSPSLLTKIGKTVGRVAGPVGTGLSIADAIARYKAGDYSGAVLSTLSAIPGISIPITLAQLGTDYMGWTGAGKDEGGLASLPEAQPIGERPKTTYYNTWTPEQLTGPLWSAGESYLTPEAWSKSPKMSPPGLDAYDRVFTDRVNWNRDWANKKIAEIQAQNYSPETEARYIADRKRHLENVEDLVNRQTTDFNTQRNWAYGQLNLPVPTQPYTPIGFQNQQQGLPSLMKIVNEQQNPTPVDPNAPYGYVEYTPPFQGGMLIPPGGIKPIRVPADQYGNPIKPGLKAI